ncbi:unnamed protein product [Victoria cruziana]
MMERVVLGPEAEPEAEVGLGPVWEELVQMEVAYLGNSYGILNLEEVPDGISGTPRWFK